MKTTQPEARGKAGLVKVSSADTLRELGSIIIDAAPLPVAEVTTQGQLAVLAHDSVNGVVETVLIDTSRWSVDHTQVLKAAPEGRTPMYGARTNRGRVVVQEGTTVALYDLASGVRTPLIDVKSSVTSEPGFGFSPDGRTLAVSAHAEGKLYVLPLDPSEWSTTACGRLWGATPGPELARQMKESKALIQGCHS